MSTPYTATPNPAASAPNPYQQTLPRSNVSPGLAFLLGLIPGVGAIYNGQYVKGLVHAVIIGVLMSLANATEESAGQPLIIMVLIGFWGYMAFEAFHTAKKRQAGVPVDEWSSLITPNRYMSRAPIGPVLLIALGVLFLLDNMHVIAFRDLARFWPVLLIVAGAVMLYNRVTSVRSPGGVLNQSLDNAPMESTHEQ